MNEEDRRLYQEDYSCPECKSEGKRVYYNSGSRRAHQMLQHRRFYHAGEANYAPEPYQKK